MQNLLAVSDTTKKICELERTLKYLESSLDAKMQSYIDSLKDQISDLENILRSDYIKEVDGFVITPITRKEYYERGTDDSLVPSWDFKGIWMYLELSDDFYIKIDVTKIESDDLAELDICELADSIMRNF